MDPSRKRQNKPRKKLEKQKETTATRAAVLQKVLYKSVALWFCNTALEVGFKNPYFFLQFLIYSLPVNLPPEPAF